MDNTSGLMMVKISEAQLSFQAEAKKGNGLPADIRLHNLYKTATDKFCETETQMQQNILRIFNVFTHLLKITT